jgi:hypothetical protein
MSSIRIEIGFGYGFTKNGNPIAGDFAQVGWQTIRDAAIKEFGGYFIHTGMGGWKDGDEPPVFESGAVMSIYAEDTASNKARAMDLAVTIRKALNQQSVCMAIIPCGFAFCSE